MIGTTREQRDELLAKCEASAFCKCGDFLMITKAPPEAEADVAERLRKSIPKKLADFKKKQTHAECGEATREQWERHGIAAGMFSK